jgi:hypothetical protein
MDPGIYRRWDQVPKRSKHPLLTGRTRREPFKTQRLLVVKISGSRLGKRKNPQSKSVRQIRKTEEIRSKNIHIK